MAKATLTKLTNSEEEIKHICDFSRGVLNTRSTRSYPTLAPRSQICFISSSLFCLLGADDSVNHQKLLFLYVFIAFPGETVTLEEFSEVMSKVSLNQLDSPCILYNLDGYYNSLRELLVHMIEKGLSPKERQQEIYFACMRPMLNKKIRLLSELIEHTLANEIELPKEHLRKEFQ